MNTTEKILKSLKEIFPSEVYSVVDDPNIYIDDQLPNREFRWYPPYMVHSGDTIFMFQTLNGEYFDENEFKEEQSEAQRLIEGFRSTGRNVKVFYIVRDRETLDKLIAANLSEDFGLFMDMEDQNPSIIFEIQKYFPGNCKLLPSVLDYLANCRNLRGTIGKIVKSFSSTYLSERSDGEKEIQMIEEFIHDLLHSDPRFDLTVEPINYMGDIERTLNSKRKIRDHYFHAFNTMLMGFMFIDKYYAEFSSLISQYGDDIETEFIWLLISLYHDIGYTSSLLEEIISQSVDFDGEPDLLKQRVEQLRQDTLELTDYKFLVTVLNDLFDHIINQRGKWSYDAFPRPPLIESSFMQSLSKSYIEGAHGAASTFKLAKLALKILTKLSGTKDREYLYRHILLASIFLIFHDLKVRNCFRENGVCVIKAETFPLSLLLTYVDIIQDDRRDIEGVYTRPDIFKDVRDRRGKIAAVLKAEALTNSLKIRLMAQLSESLSFFEMNGITLLLPEELS